ncbi:uncharacterized protein LOC125655923 isoform X5 [Ostrea edulis]|uniref:uncharacterized protein LOC125655923 isoform X5 n=1 Tax=Ostrea edulis TaxID=37623 RepID=UPI0024AEA4B5|nr:uncharacterized protein LOC125655923 isoform X5 [Ostrea edulis]
MEVSQRPRTTEMTFWSRYDPIRQVKGSTDHWAKYRQETGNHLELIGHGLRGTMPGAYSSSRPKSTFNKNHYRNVFSERAKEGFRYWLIQRPKPTSFGKYGMGSYKTVLGIGNAPRS